MTVYTNVTTITQYRVSRVVTHPGPEPHTLTSVFTNRDKALSFYRHALRVQRQHPELMSDVGFQSREVRQEFDSWTDASTEP